MKVSFHLIKRGTMSYTRRDNNRRRDDNGRRYDYNDSKPGRLNADDRGHLRRDEEYGPRRERRPMYRETRYQKKNFWEKKTFLFNFSFF